MAFSHVLRMKPLLKHRLFSSITQPDSAIHKQKIQSALSLLKSINHNNNPGEQILYVCLSNTISDLPPPCPSNTIHSFLHELNTQPALMSSFLEELKMQPHFRKERMFSHIITVYGQAGMFLSSKKTFEEMPAKGIVRSAESLNAFLGAALHSSDRIVEANEIFTDYPITYGITRNVDTYNLFLKAWLRYKSKNWMLFTALNVMSKEGCKPDETTYRTISAGLSDKTPDEVVKVLAFMDNHNIFLEYIDIYDLGIQSLCKSKKPAEAKRLFDKITSRGMESSPVTYQQLMESLCEGGHHETALETCIDCMKKDWFPSMAKTVVNELLTSSKHKELEKMLQMMETHGLRPNLDIHNLCLEMRANGVQPDASCYKALIKYICQIRDPEALYQACQDCMKEEWFPSFLSSTLETLVVDLLVDSRPEDVGLLLGIMESLGLQPSLDINFVTRTSNEMKRQSLVYDMFEKGVEPDQRFCNQLIQQLCDKENDYTTAFFVCKKCMSMPWFPNFVSTNLTTLKTLCEGLVDNLSFNEIKELLDMLKKHESSQLSEIYSTTLDRMYSINADEEAAHIYESSSSLNIKLNEDTYLNLVDFFCRPSRLENLDKVLFDMSKKGVEIDSGCYRNMVGFLCGHNHRVDHAVRVTYECMSKKWFARFVSQDTSAIKTLVDWLKKESRFEEVLKLLEAMKKNGLQPNLSLFFQ